MALDSNDLEGRIEDLIHIDEYKPKMGTDDNIIVATFKVMGKQPAQDLENFIEKGYDWVIDAETSAGEISDGKYIVFIESERRTSFPKNFMDMISDISNITDIESYEFMYFDKPSSNKNAIQPLTQENLARSIPLSPRKYRASKTAQVAIESILNTARVPRSKGDIEHFAIHQPKERI